MTNPATEILGSIRTLFALLDPTSRRRLYILLGLGVVNMAIEMAAVLGFIVLLFHLTDPGYTVWDNEALRVLADILPIEGVGTPELIAGILIAYTAKNILRLAEIYAREDVGERIGARYSALLYGHYLSAPLLLHLERSSSWMVDAVWNSSDHTVRQAVRSFQALVADALMALGIFLVLLRASPDVAFLVGASLGVVSLLLLALMHRHFARVGNRFRDLDVEAYDTLQQSFRGIREVKLFQKEPAFLDRFTRLRGRLRSLLLSNGMYEYAPTVVLEMVFIASFAGLGFYAWFNVERAWLLPLIGTYAFCGVRLLPAANRMVHAANRLRSAGPVLAVLRTELEEVEESADPKDFPATDSDDAGDPLITLAVENVGFEYPGPNGFRLDQLNFRIPAGRSVAILGESGSGKTTLLHLLAGLLPNDSGRILLNGHPVVTASPAWRSRVGYVAQDPFVLTDTVAANIALDPDVDPDDPRLMEALRDAQLDEWVAGLSDGTRTQVGEGGRRISGGQRQRLAIARALYKQPSLLLFDEPTSALDTGTERALEDALLRMETGVTRVIVTHRIATAKRCDDILYLRDGRLAAAGSYDALVESSDDFRKFAEGA